MADGTPPASAGATTDSMSGLARPALPTSDVTFVSPTSTWKIILSLSTGFFLLPLPFGLAFFFFAGLPLVAVALATSITLLATNVDAASSIWFCSCRASASSSRPTTEEVIV